MSYAKVFDEGEFYKDVTFTQLSAPGTTASVDVDGLNKHVFQVKVSAGSTVVVIEASNDGTNYYRLPINPLGSTTSWVLAVGNQMVSTAAGTFLVQLTASVKWIRLNATAVPGTADVVYHGGV